MNCWRGSRVMNSTLFLRLLKDEDKGLALKAAIEAVSQGVPCDKAFRVEPRSFKQVPGSPFAYWVSEGIRATFCNILSLESRGYITRLGMTTNSDFRFLRLFPEKADNASGASLVGYSKGGIHSQYYADVVLYLKWNNNGSEVKAFSETTPGTTHWSRNIRSPEYYFRPGLTWPRRTTSGLSVRALPRGCIFADKGPAAFVEDDVPEMLLGLLAVMNSGAFRLLVSLQLAAADAAARSYEVGLIQQTPVPDPSDADTSALADLSRRAWSLKRSSDAANETSHAFWLPALLQADGLTLDDQVQDWNARLMTWARELTDIQADIDDRCFDLYGISEADRSAMAETTGDSSEAPGAGDEADGDAGDEEMLCDPARLAASLLSWAVGVAMGRFDIRMATGERSAPEEPDPFDSLPPRSPGMLPETVDDYSFPVPESGILVDDPGHNADLLGRVENVFETLWGEDGAERLHEAARMLGCRNEDLRPWFQKDFFADHIRRYSKSRRKAPVYWQLATPSRSYSVWVYYHRFTKDTLYRVLNDYVTPKVQHEGRKLTGLMQEAGPEPSSSQRKDIDAQQTFVEELRAFRDEVARVTPLWNPDLNDGVIINFAPLWRLVPQHRAWQKDCKSCWDKLVKGDYDWAHLAMHLWPERVVPKCAKDRSLAIAHGLDEIFWEEDDKGKSKPRKVSPAEIDRLIQERTSPSIKAALNDLLSASVTSAAPKKRAGRTKRT